MPPGSTKEAVAGEVVPPCIVKLSVEGLLSSLFGTNTSMRRSPARGPEDAVKPNGLGGFAVVGVLVPLSIWQVARGPMQP
jgi:hypothetical protein